MDCQHGFAHTYFSKITLRCDTQRRLRLEHMFPQRQKQINAKSGKRMPHILCMGVDYALQLIRNSIFINNIGMFAGE